MERMLRLVWCEACCNRHWEVVRDLSESGRAVSKSGRLKLPLICVSCRNELAVGEEVTAFTIDSGPNHEAWEDRYLDLDPESDGEMDVEKEGAWAKG